MLRRDAVRWLRQRRAQLYVDMLMSARAEQFYLSFVTFSDTAWESVRADQPRYVRDLVGVMEGGPAGPGHRRQGQHR